MRKNKKRGEKGAKTNNISKSNEHEVKSKNG